MKKTKLKHIPDANEFINRYFIELTRCILSLDKTKIELIVDLLVNAYQQGRTVFIVGNGGSASTASHMACDLSKGTLQRIYDQRERRFRVISLTDNVAVMTAFANDVSFDDIFVQQLRNLVNTDDVVIALSGSGNSPNVVRAVEYAKKCGAKTVGILGFKTGGKLGKLVDLPLIVDSNNYGPIEDIQLIINHIIAAWIGKIKHIHDNTETGKNKAVPFK